MKIKEIVATLAGILIPLLLIVLIQHTKYLKFGSTSDMNNFVDASKHEFTSVDHSKFEQLNKEFKTGPEVTIACLECHNNRDAEIMQTAHWKWQRDEKLKGKGVVSLGKRNILNNFCIGTRSNEQTCTRCHIGYGWQDKSFDFGESSNIDCLVCHDNSGTYKKKRGGAGHVDPNVSLRYVAQSVGEPGRENCGVCHFWGGGGNNVKHGDLEKSMLDCKREVDVHMATDGANMSCVECHKAENHQMQGKLYALSSENKDRMHCESCHSEAPHQDKMLDEHIIRIACQTCHIPYYAKVNSTKMIWDWSSAGELDEDGHAKHENDEDGNHKYMSIKGTFVWDDNVKPEYYWFNGTANHYLIEEKIDTVPLQMNTLYGCYKDKGDCQESVAPSKIWPVKVHRGKQIYDTETKTLIQLKTFGEKGTGAFWSDFDWDKAAEKGMEYIGMEYSGNYDFVETEMYWPLNHQVAPKEHSLQCIDCHTREGGRLDGLNDFYLPGRDANAFVEWSGIVFIILAFGGSVAHAICRIIFKRNCKYNQ